MSQVPAVVLKQKVLQASRDYNVRCVFKKKLKEAMFNKEIVDIRFILLYLTHLFSEQKFVMETLFFDAEI